MIQRIKINNFAIIEDVETEFHDGLNIVTGETGAGKSIVIQAMSLALGSRADMTFVRTGQEKATVQMIATLDGSEYVITRELSSGGRNLCKINGEIVTLAQLSALCRKLADIHGQYDHQSLLDPEEHIHLLDRYGGEPVQSARSETEKIFGEYSKIKNEILTLRRERAEYQRQRDFLEFEYRELTSAALKDGEDAELEEEAERLRHSEQIYESLSYAYQISEGDEAAILPALKQIVNNLRSAAEWSREAQDLADRMDSIYYDLEDLSGDIRKARDASLFSPEELDSMIQRLDMLNRLKQKHGKSIAELIEYRDRLEAQLARASVAESNESELMEKLRRSASDLKASCDRLTGLRKTAAASLEKEISGELEELNFSRGEFKVDFSPTENPTSSGCDNVEFLLSTNKGEELKPLAKIASGGEMSRIMLAFKKIIGKYDEIPTMIFDEIDSGISGIAASVVGRKLKEISRDHQIICITHLPQIAACGDYHYRISKDSDETMTFTHVDQLSSEERVEEIARLLGGSDVTDTTRQAARELLG